ncbi:ankyrin repeat-containing domain protein [Mycena albidolilacea]|uniref:Ankyrin repeat-containing domain protein n=1 Tax=Mycena albidolilacea TaxID=1033008 RepID=A0AAD7AKL9_9AGAR|nr:ankyrin repeat-containing domain protein [Mycena albidolilacea]
MRITDCSPELVLHIVSFLEIILDSEYSECDYHLGRVSLEELVTVPDLASINALSQTSTSFYHTIDETLHRLCASVDELGSLALLFAVEHQLEGTLDKLVAAGMSLDVVAAHHSIQCTPLHIAAHTGGLEMVTPRQRWIIYAVHKGHLEIVKLLVPIPVPSFVVRDGLVSNGRYLGDGLVQSTAAGDLEISQYLIMAGADVNHDRGGYNMRDTSIPIAAGSANLGLVQFLLASGADPNLPTHFGSTPLFNAANVDIVRTLLSAGANIHAQNTGSQNVLPTFMIEIEMLQFFLERGVDPNHIDDNGETASPRV